MSLVGRFGHARGIEQLQLRWVALAAVLVGLGAVGVLVRLAVEGAAAGTLFDLAVGCCLLVLRRWPPGRRCCATGCMTWTGSSAGRWPGLLTLVLGGGYALVVLGLGQLLGRGVPPGGGGRHPGRGRAVPAGPPPPSSRGGSALQPPPPRHDPEHQGFRDRLRDQVDLDTLTTDLLAVVDQTMQPTQASLWLRPPPEPARPPPGALASP